LVGLQGLIQEPQGLPSRRVARVLEDCQQILDRGRRILCS
jgi:hypothetical protein